MSFESEAAKHIIKAMNIRQCGEDRYYRDIGGLRKFYTKAELLKLLKRVAGIK